MAARALKRFVTGVGPVLAFVLLLLVSLLLLTVLSTLLSNSPIARWLLDTTFSLVLVAAVFAVSHRRRLLAVGLVLGLPALASIWVESAVATNWPGYDYPFVVGQR